MTIPSLIALCGPIGSGKSTIAEHLCTRWGYTRVRFAGPLKDMLRAVGLNARELDGDLKEAPTPLLCGKTPRHAMQTLGTEWGRQLIHPDIWINLWRGRVIEAWSDGGSHAGKVVVDDLRFENEEAAIRDLNGVIWKVERLDGYVAQASAKHQSEAYAPRVDLAIANIGTLTDLYEMVNAVLTEKNV